MSKSIKTLPTIGGKTNMLDVLPPIFNDTMKRKEIDVFVDVFGGGNKFIPQIDRSKLHSIIFNDIDLGIFNLMSLLTNPSDAKKVTELTYHLKKRINNEEEFKAAIYKRNLPETSPVESAALTIIVFEMSRASDRKSYSHENMRKGLRYETIARYQELVPYMRNVTVTRLGYEYFIKTYGHRSNYLFVLDPPYVDKDCYGSGFGEAEQNEMIKLLVDVKAHVVLCGIDNVVYKFLEDNGWHKYSIKEIFKNSAAKRGITQKEFIWCNYKLPSYKSEIQAFFPYNKI